jgi:amphi-Trp domain-containing protein
MPEEILFENEQYLDRSAVASYLRTVADRLDEGNPISLKSGGESVSVAVPSTVEFEVTVEREGPADGSGEIGFELELEWDEKAAEAADDGLSIE